ncbi:WxL domain-containing protein [Vagococcus fluvialis]|uniref:WxL domain-containing protein n=1 Tax=Vagococcus fluvialis TaxID=2738 RepID=A0A7X6I462_9ENTE|nr:WxL domain-containing protein [Vagococcus fluvialis]NKC68529.1 WxL domain-containing protein [Vagococcus fluvialis]
MKISKLLTVSLLSFSILGGFNQVSKAAAVDGDPIEADTSGKVTFSTKSDIITPDPDGPGTVIPEDKPGGNSNTSDPDLKIMFVPNFVFGENVDGKFKENVQYDSINGNKLEAMQQVVTIKDEDGNEIETGKKVDNFAQIYNSKNINNWKLTVNASYFSTTGNKLQESMLMKLNNVQVSDSESHFGKKALLTGVASKTLTPNAAVEIGSYDDEATEGAVNSFIFASTTNPNQAGVTLDVPKGLSIENDEVYTSNLTWTVSSNVE